MPNIYKEKVRERMKESIEKWTGIFRVKSSGDLVLGTQRGSFVRIQNNEYNVELFERVSCRFCKNYIREGSGRFCQSCGRFQ
jgi:hypothetical protein